MSYQYDNKAYVPRTYIMKDPVSKFRFDEDSDQDFYNRHKKAPHHHQNSYYGTATDNNIPSKPVHSKGDSLHRHSSSSRPNSGFIDHIPDYTDSSMDYLEAGHDLSPIRGDYIVSPTTPTSYDGLMANRGPTVPSRQVIQPTRPNPQKSDYHYDSGFPMSYSNDYSSDHNSNLLSTSPNKNIPDKVVMMNSREYSNNGVDSSQSYLDVSKSASSGDSRGGDYNNGSRSNSNYYSDTRVLDSQPMSLKRAREQNLRDNLRYRSTSLGESRTNVSKEVQRPRTPSAPGELNISAQSYYGRNKDIINIHSQSERSMISDKSRSVLFNQSVQSRLSRIDMDRSTSLSRSIMSGEYRVREHDKSVLNGDNNLNRSLHSTASRDLVDTRYTSLSRDPLNTAHHRNKLPPTGKLQPNGSAKLISDHPNTNTLNNSDQSTTTTKDNSKDSLNGHRHIMIYGRDYGVINSLVSLALMALLSLVIVFISVQLLFHLNSRTATGLLPHTNSVLTNSSYGNVLEVTIALTTFVVMLDLCCLLVCSMQCFFAAKLVKCSQGEERCFKYLKECAGTRFIAVTGFFISIPTLLIALLLYMLLEFAATPAIIGTVIFTVGLTFTFITIIHSTYFWRVEKNKADLNIPAYDKKTDGTLSQSELSTLV